METAGMEEIDQLLEALQSANNTFRSQAEAQLELRFQNPVFLTALMMRAHQAPALSSRQLAATLLSWRFPRMWPCLGQEDAANAQAALLECYASCSELPVLRALGEACNALCQSMVVHR